MCQEAEAKQWSVDVPILQLKNKNKMDRFGTIKINKDSERPIEKLFAEPSNAKRNLRKAA